MTPDTPPGERGAGGDLAQGDRAGRAATALHVALGFAGAVLTLGIAVAVFLYRGWGVVEGGPGSRTAIQSTPGVVAAMRDMARLDSTSFHIEKVVEARDQQSRLWGLVQPKDAILLVAVGDVVAGVDLSRLRDDDVRLDPSTRRVRVRLPAPEITSSSLDERSTHVVSRVTDVLAERNEKLEGEARSQAEQEMRQAAIDAGILERARASADRTLAALLRSLGYDDVEIVFGERALHETPAGPAP